MKIEELLKKAKTLSKKPLAIVDVYDFTFVWVSKDFCKITGFEKSELINSQTFKIRLDKPIPSQIEETDIVTQKKGMIKKIPIKTKKGKAITLKIKIIPFTFEETPYMIGELLEVKK